MRRNRAVIISTTVVKVQRDVKDGGVRVTALALAWCRDVVFLGVTHTGMAHTGVLPLVQRSGVVVAIARRRNAYPCAEGG